MLVEGGSQPPDTSVGHVIVVLGTMFMRTACDGERLVSSNNSQQEHDDLLDLHSDGVPQCLKLPLRGLS